MKFGKNTYGDHNTNASFDIGESNINTVDLPVNVGVIKCGNELMLYDSGWKQLAYIFDWNTSCCWWDAPNQIKNIGLDPAAVTRIVIGHGHWDHAGQLDRQTVSEDFGNIPVAAGIPYTYWGFGFTDPQVAGDKNVLSL